MNLKMLKLIFTVFTVIILSACKSDGDFPQLRGPYLGQTPPDSLPQLFAPGIVSTGMFTRDIAISPDGKEIYFTVDIGNHKYMTIMVTRQIDGLWQEPQVVPFATDFNYHYLEPHISPDGQKLFFASNQPLIDSVEAPGDANIWFAEREGDGWSDPLPLGAPVNTEAPEFFPSTTTDGTLYFTRDDPETRLSIIYRSRLTDGKYSEPEALPESVNAGRSRYNAFIAPDESYIIVPVWGRADSHGGTDYYISFHQSGDGWSAPLNLGGIINSDDRQEYSPYVSPDGKYFFFMSGRSKTPQFSAPVTLDDVRRFYNQPRNGHADIYWVSADFIKALRKKAGKQATVKKNEK